ncbi:MAG: TIGR03364 family FAD-dependent oxidoreductase [Capsulimonadales bacterium]|nr:TIGR03364 family FAD-dependent oxidoreductase [Capsulimonadales bacterium]
MEQWDDIVVGAGILGLAHAYHLGRQGRRVLVCERHARAQGASVRNFGMIWPIGQPIGEMYDLALRSRAFWLNLLPAAGLWYAPVGSLHLAYHPDEAQVLFEFSEAAKTNGFQGIQLFPSFEVGARFGAVRPEGLRGALFSETEVCVDPREVVARLPDFLTARFGVTFRFGTAVTHSEAGTVRLADGRTARGQVYVCSGDEMGVLYPRQFREMGLLRCKLQMLRTEPMGEWMLGPMLAAGLTLCHYRSFAHCPTLPALKERLEREMPEYRRYGIHVMASQNGRGELTLGDSHEYDDAISVFDSEEIDRLVLSYLATFLKADFRVTSRWNGIYVKHPEKPYVIARPEPNVTLVTGVGGAGMTLSFGLAEKVVMEQRAGTDRP